MPLIKSISIILFITTMLVLNLGHNPLYRHFYKCLYIELLKFYLFIDNYIHFTHK